ncbi:MAG: hypothetical protein ACO2ZM_02770 [Francisellaceae bacterium]
MANLSGFPFGKEVKTYKQPPLVTPFQALNQRLDKPLGQLVYRAYIWRVVFMVSASIALLLSLYFLALMSSSPFKILVEQVTKTGFLTTQPSLLKPDYRISNTAFRLTFIKLLGSDESSGSLAKGAQEKWAELSAIVGKANRRGVRLSDVNVDGHRFSMTLQLKKGKNVKAMKISGDFITKAPENESQVLMNPLGIYIVDINYEDDQA